MALHQLPATLRTIPAPIRLEREPTGVTYAVYADGSRVLWLSGPVLVLNPLYVR
jgi:hypothetical protein